MGGVGQCSDIKVNLLRRLAAVTVQAELIEARMVNGEAVEIGTLCTLASTTVRLSQRLGIERGGRSGRAAEELEHDLPPVRTLPVLGEINALPCTEGEPARHHRHGERHASQHGFDMGGHVVRSFHVVRPARTDGSKAVKRSDEIGTHIGIGILLNNERSRGVPDVEEQRSLGRARPRHEALRLLRDLDKTPAVRVHAQRRGRDERDGRLPYRAQPPWHQARPD